MKNKILGISHVEKLEQFQNKTAVAVQNIELVGYYRNSRQRSHPLVTTSVEKDSTVFIKNASIEDGQMIEIETEWLIHKLPGFQFYFENENLSEVIESYLKLQ
ncbi:MAG: hypothetical protein KBB88_02805 [Candidatus Pacebacteria bacterium]|nr:hypothetical protein [Candidatus Paceibacterota bacterium]